MQGALTSTGKGKLRAGRALLASVLVTVCHHEISTVAKQEPLPAGSAIAPCYTSEREAVNGLTGLGAHLIVQWLGIIPCVQGSPTGTSSDCSSKS